MVAKIIKGDEVFVLSGKDKGKIGLVLKVLNVKTKTSILKKVLVSGVALKHVFNKNKRSKMNNQDGILKKETPIDISNVAFWDGVSKSYGKVFIKEDQGCMCRFFRPTGNKIKKSIK